MWTPVRVCMFVCLSVCKTEMVHVSGAVYHLVREGNRGAVDERTLFISALQEEGQELSFPFHIDGPSAHKPESILLQDDITVLHHLGAIKLLNERALYRAV